MQLYPAIDLKDGKCVRMVKGNIMDATIYNDNPLAQATTFQSLGFNWLHLVDINAAMSGKSVNKAAVERILKVVKMPIQLGGGIRDRASAEAWLTAGVKRLVLATSAIKNFQLVAELAHAFPGQIVVSIDTRDGFATTDGWVQDSSMRAVDLARRCEDAGVAALIHTDVNRDGTFAGPNIPETAAIAKVVSIPVTLSGGIKTKEHVAEVMQQPNIDGIIIGKALYERTFDIRTVLAMCGNVSVNAPAVPAPKAAPAAKPASDGDIW
jgi:phosphoribosylformimino-5-aminoimidazole carboxamide ribotide isomerase